MPLQDQACKFSSCFLRLFRQAIVALLGQTFAAAASGASAINMQADGADP